MSVKMTKHVFRASKSSGAGRLALVALASLADDAGEVEVTYADLSLLLNCNRRNAIRAVQTLLDRGELELVELSPGGSHANSYKITIYNGVNIDTARGVNIDTADQIRGVNIDTPEGPRGVNIDTAQVVNVLQLPPSVVKVSKTSIDKTVAKTPPPISPPAKPKPKNKTSLPDDWEPTDHASKIANEEGYDDEEKGIILAQFKDSASANNRKYADWDRAFYNWIRSGYTSNDIQQRRRAQNARSKQGPRSGQLAAAGARFMSRRATGA